MYVYVYIQIGRQINIYEYFLNKRFRSIRVMCVIENVTQTFSQYLL